MKISNIPIAIGAIVLGVTIFTTNVQTILYGAGALAIGYGVSKLVEVLEKAKYKGE